MVKVARRTNVFEKILLVMGLGVVLLGLFLLDRIIGLEEGVTSSVILFVMLWLMLIFMIIGVAIAENIREDLTILIYENSQELKYLRNISQEQIEEVRLLTKLLKK
ncbi:MAG: hypothetical protein ACMXYF_03100 [Candidatus Woesearchaeota archaeon]